MRSHVIDEIVQAVLNPEDMRRPTLRQPVVLHLYEQHHRDHRRPFDNRLVAESVRRIIDEDTGAHAS